MVSFALADTLSFGIEVPMIILEKKHPAAICAPARFFLLLVAMTITGTAAAVTSSPGYDYGFTPFPYDSTAEAFLKTRETIIPNSNLYALHYDDCVPWQAALADRPFPASIANKWRDDARGIPADHKVYVGLAPLAKDRRNLAPDCGRMPAGLARARFDDPRIVKAFVTYARRAIETFSPSYLNIGIEAGELMTRDFRRWQDFERFFNQVYDALKKSSPNVKIGISFGLQSLLEKKHARAARALVDKSDYLGLSFYPHASRFGEKFGAPALGPHPQSWRQALQWVSQYTDKPIAIAETGFSSHDISMPGYGLHMKGSPDWQAQYVHDLLAAARERSYLFVVWFLAIDYDDLYERMPKTKENQANLIWKNIGLLDGKRRPKPAWDEWRRMNGIDPNSHLAALATSTAPRTGTATTAPSTGQGLTFVELGFRSPDDLFQCDPNSQTSWQASAGHQGRPAMRWQYNYRQKDWKWCVRELPAGRLQDASTIQFWVKAKNPGRLFLQLEEKGGEAFFTTLDVDGNWQAVDIDLGELQPDPAKRQNGRLDKGQLSKILLADFDDSRTASDQQTIWLSALGYRSVSAVPGKQSSSGRRVHRLGFSDARQLPTCAPESRTDIASTTEGPVMRWRFPRKKDNWQWCLKELSGAGLGNSSELTLRLRSDHPEPLFLQLEEKSGEAFFTLLNPTPDWQTLTIPLADFQVDPKKARDGKLEPARISKWLIADPQGGIGGGGSRTVMIGDLLAR